MSDMGVERISVRLKADLRRRLGEQASQRGLSESDVVRDALQEYLRKRTQSRACYDLARSAGILGAIEDSPPDMSTNRKYLRGFGRR